MPSLAPKPIIYVSSTFVDLEQHRAALKAALEKAQYDVECMEGTSNNQQFAGSLRA